MISSAVYFIGTVAFLASVLTLAGSFALQLRNDVTHMIDVVGGLGSAVAWVVFALGATALEVPLDTEIVARSEPMLTYFGAGMAVFMVVVAFVGTAGLLDVRDVEARV